MPRTIKTRSTRPKNKQTINKVHSPGQINTVVNMLITKFELKKKEIQKLIEKCCINSIWSEDFSKLKSMVIFRKHTDNINIESIEIMYMLTNSHCRNEGLAKKLLNNITHENMNSFITLSAVKTKTSKNSVVHFYERLGFSKVENIPKTKKLTHMLNSMLPQVCECVMIKAPLQLPVLHKRKYDPSPIKTPPKTTQFKTTLPILKAPEPKKTKHCEEETTTPMIRCDTFKNSCRKLTFTTIGPSPPPTDDESMNSNDKTQPENIHNPSPIKTPPETTPFNVIRTLPILKAPKSKTTKSCEEKTTTPKIKKTLKNSSRLIFNEIGPSPPPTDDERTDERNIDTFKNDLKTWSTAKITFFFGMQNTVDLKSDENLMKDIISLSTVYNSNKSEIDDLLVKRLEQNKTDESNFSIEDLKQKNAEDNNLEFVRFEKYGQRIRCKRCQMSLQRCKSTTWCIEREDTGRAYE